ncbi:MAG TPA: S8 family serine peptidase, partial [Anaerolineae bacterium]|nr:S8 family serine peptidase [Anaerolineae bacterium]
MRRKMQRAIHLLTVTAILLSLVGLAPASATRPSANLARLAPASTTEAAPLAARPSSNQPDGPAGVASASEKLIQLKVAPDLRDAVRKADDAVLSVFMTIKAGYDPVPAMVRGVVRPLVVADQQLAFGQIRAIDLVKLLGDENVLAVQKVDFNMTAAPPPRDPELGGHPLPTGELRAHLAALGGNDVWYSAAPQRDVRPADWRDVLTDTHKSKLAWDKGYTGVGVKVATLDDGVDFAHPDLQGTFARIPITTTAWTTATNPYYDAGAGLAWPYVFSPISSLYYAYDYWFGLSFVEDCAAGTHLVDTSATPLAVSLIPGTKQATFTPNSSCSDTFTHNYIFSDTSLSGVYHFGSHPDHNLIDLYDERPAVLVVDEGRYGHAAGVYDTVYVDLDNDYDFRDEKPMTIASPESYRDLWDIDYVPGPDGFADLSGGLLYWISDGASPVPGTDWMWGVGAFGVDEGPGDLVGLEGPFDSGYSHGTQLTSNIVGQGRINGYHWDFADVGTPAAGVLGHAPGAKSVAITNIYRNFGSSKLDGYLMASFGPDGVSNSGDEVQITNNSYGSSDQDNDNWEYDGRFIANLQRNLAPNTVHMFSTGNGAPGYGTVAPPSPSTGIGVCASTQFGSTGWDNPENASQILANDIVQWSNRGPGARGNNGVDVCANGAWGGGIEALNYFGANGAASWSTWGGTSRSSPVSAGIMALIYQAYRQEFGVWPDYDTARALLKSSSTNVNYNALVQGAGVLNALRGVEVAGGEYGVYVTPDEWNPGDYRGTDYPAFAHLVSAGDTLTRSITVHNTGATTITVGIRDGEHRRIGSTSFTRVTSNANETAPTFNAPNYLIPITSTVAAYQNIAVPADTKLMVVRENFPYSQFDPDGNYNQNQNWRLLVYNWSDNNSDGNLWTDTNLNSSVNYSTTVWNGTTCVNIDFFPCVTGGELDAGEYVRFGYHRAFANNHQLWVHDPLARMDDGLFIGLQHSQVSSAIPTTTFSFQVDFYGIDDNAWLAESTSSLQVPAGASRTFDVTLSVPGDADAGIYEAALYVDDPGDAGHLAHTTVVPVVVNVAEDFTPGDIVTLGGMDAFDADAMYNNAGVQGTFDWSWRAESGDWRFFMLDVPVTPTVGTAWLIRDVWDDGYPTDIDTLVMGRTRDAFSNGPTAGNPSDGLFDLRDQLCAIFGNAVFGGLGCDTQDSFYGGFVTQDPAYYGPYTEATVGGSANTYLGSGKWVFDTATGGAEEWVVAPIQEGLHIVAEHNVNFSGAKFTVPYTKTVSSINLTPATIEITTSVNTGAVPITFTSGLTLPTGLAAAAFGLGAPTVYSAQTVTQDDDQDPSTDTFNTANGFTNYDFTVENGASILAETFNATTSDIDMYLFYDDAGDGFQYGDLVASSTTPTSNESVAVVRPGDGNWRLSLHGWDVTGGGTYNLRLTVVQGFDLSVSGVPTGTVNAGAPVVLTVNYAKIMQPGSTYEGLLLLGPSVAPNALAVPVIIHRTGTGTPNLTTSTKTADRSIAPVGAQVQYTINVVNTSPVTATTAAFVDLIPAGTTYVAGSLVG